MHDDPESDQRHSIAVTVIVDPMHDNSNSLFHPMLHEHDSVEHSVQRLHRTITIQHHHPHSAPIQHTVSLQHAVHPHHTITLHTQHPSTHIRPPQTAQSRRHHPAATTTQQKPSSTCSRHATLHHNHHKALPQMRRRHHRHHPHHRRDTDLHSARGNARVQPSRPIIRRSFSPYDCATTALVLVLALHHLLDKVICATYAKQNDEE
ncbi:hypothetical protein EJ05DRAFT_479511 [Pseudovirgaria hyperparasitica]|uniref:Uncharacterized protein n=1 Tax=Pseudovirgaria hyperparasitica TaxID=470096 RepID=A0A6A6VXI2_9PEZI|nr:uncharacterized protein EJ05DRAFT_479511 [Pseudovirgaria hyperparasitica]KAF2754539.1 hypothetical protein EJ05DRAFT_479511 [Pseudovirgaria hyperparasitica]